MVMSIYIYRTEITDALHDAFGFRTDLEIVIQKELNKFKANEKSEIVRSIKYRKNRRKR